MKLKQRKSKVNNVSGLTVKNRGFGLVEAMIALLLVLLAVLMGSRMMISAMQSLRKSRLNINLLLELESFKNKLLSTSFDADTWQTGNQQEEVKNYRLDWTVRVLSPSLKKADISIYYNTTGLKRRTFIYKSKFLNNCILGDSRTLD